MSALNPQLMNILITEYFSDPTNRGYRKYGNMMLSDGEVLFYAPQILSLVNEPQNIMVMFCDHDGECSDHLDQHRYEMKQAGAPPRIGEIFAGIADAPNVLLVEHLVQVYNYFKSLNPNLVNTLRTE